MTRLLYMQKQNYFVVILYKNSFCTPGQFFSFDKIKGLLLYIFFYIIINLHNYNQNMFSQQTIILKNMTCYFKKRLWCQFQILSLTFVNYPIKLMIKYIHSTQRAIHNLLHLYRAFWMRYSISGASLFWSTYNSKKFQF